MNNLKSVEEWSRAYLTKHPDVSLDDLCREAITEMGTGHGVGKATMADIRRRWRQEQDAAPTPPPQPVVAPAIPSKVMRCLRCGSLGHWVSQCTEPLRLTPEMLISPAPGISVARVVLAEMKEEVRSGVEAVAELREMETRLLALKKDEERKAKERPLEDVGRKKTAAGTAVRRERLNAMLEADPGADPVMLIANIRAEYGRGLDWGYVYDTCRIAREIHQLPQLAEHSFAARPFQGREPMPTFGAEPAPAPEELALEAEEELTPEEEMAYVAQKLAEVVRAHRLTGVSLTVSDTAVSWDYVVRRRGSVKL